MEKVTIKANELDNNVLAFKVVHKPGCLQQLADYFETGTKYAIAVISGVVIGWILF